MSWWSEKIEGEKEKTVYDPKTGRYKKVKYKEGGAGDALAMAGIMGGAALTGGALEAAAAPASGAVAGAGEATGGMAGMMSAPAAGSAAELGAIGGMPAAGAGGAATGAGAGTAAGAAATAPKTFGQSMKAGFKSLKPSVAFGPGGVSVGASGSFGPLDVGLGATGGPGGIQPFGGASMSLDEYVNAGVGSSMGGGTSGPNTGAPTAPAAASRGPVVSTAGGGNAAPQNVPQPEIGVTGPMRRSSPTTQVLRRFGTEAYEWGRSFFNPLGERSTAAPGRIPTTGQALTAEQDKQSSLLNSGTDEEDLLGL